MGESPIRGPHIERMRSAGREWTYSWPGVRDVLCRDLPLFAAKMGDGIVGDRGDFGIGVGRAERLHGGCHGMVRSAGALEDHPDQVGPLRIVDGVRAGQARTRGLLAVSVPAMATCACALEDA